MTEAEGGPRPVRVRGAEPVDLGAIVAFNRAMAEETEGLDLDRDTVRQGVARCLADPARGFYLLAEDPKTAELLGQLMVTTEWSDWRNGVQFWIQSVYVVPEARRRGVYRALHDAVLERASARGDVVGVRLYVHEGNRRAQATYERLGMQRSDYLMYELEL